MLDEVTYIATRERIFSSILDGASIPIFQISDMIDQRISTNSKEDIMYFCYPTNGK